MTFKPAVWYPISAVLSAVNVVATGFAAAPGEPIHAATHAVLAVAFGLWAQRLRQRRGEHGRVDGREERFEALEAEVGNLQGELSETLERLDFAERKLAQEVESRRINPER
jgi:hypothetical protein